MPKTIDPRTAAILEYVQGSEYRRQLARRISDALIEQYADQLIAGTVDARTIVNSLVQELGSIVDEAAQESYSHLIAMGYNPTDVTQAASFATHSIRYDLGNVAERAVVLVREAIEEVRKNKAMMAPLTDFTVEATRKGMLANSRSIMRQTAAGLVANTERLVMDSAIIEHGGQFNRPFFGLTSDVLDSAWEWYRAAPVGATTEVALTSGPVKVVKGATRSPAQYLEHGKGPAWMTVTAGETRDDVITILPGASHEGFQGTLQHELGHVASMRGGTGGWQELDKEYGKMRFHEEYHVGDKLFAWQTREDAKVCFDQFENSCYPRHGWQLTEYEWDQVGRPQAQNLLCSMFAKGATSNCRCLLIPAEAYDESLGPVDISEVTAHGREQADEAWEATE